MPVLLQKSVRIIGVDPGSRRTGFGILDVHGGGQAQYVAHGTIFLDEKKELHLRLYDLSHAIREVVGRHKPTHGALENAFVHKNVHSGLALGQARGVVLGVFALHNIRCLSLAATAVKLAVAGSGRAKKFQVAQLIALRLGVPAPVQEDAADALAVALTLTTHLDFLHA